MAEDKKDFWILALSGGGYRGLFTATVLAEMERRAGVPLATKFDLIVGTSVGSILASALAKEIPAVSLPEIFVRQGKKIFGGRWNQLPFVNALNLGIFQARYSAKGLISVLSTPDMLDQTVIGDLRHRLLIPTINLTKGSAQFFKTPHLPTYRNDGRVRLIDAVVASSSAPTYFPIYRFSNNRYADGGLVANSPSFVAFHEACYKMGIDVSRIHVVSIGTMNASVTMDPRAPLDAGLLWSGLSWRNWRFWKGWRQRVFEVTLSAQDVLAKDMLQQVLKDRVIHIDQSPTNDQAKSIGLDKVNAHANEVLQGQANLAAQKFLTGALYDKWIDHTASPAIMYPQTTSEGTGHA